MARNKIQSYKAKTILIFLSISGILLLLIFDPKIFMGGDNAYYSSLAYSMLDGKYEPYFQIGHQPETGVTPGYPAVLAVLHLIFGKTFLPAKILSFVFFLGALWVWFKIFEHTKLKLAEAIAYLSFAILNTQISEFSHWELTESMYMLLSALAIYMYSIAIERDKLLDWVLTGVFGVLCYYNRASGATISIAIFLSLLVSKKWRQIAIFATVNVVILAPWILRNFAIAGAATGGSYVNQFFIDYETGQKLSSSEFIAKMGRNLLRYFSINLPTLFFPYLENFFVKNLFWGIIFGGILSLLWCIGSFKWLRDIKKRAIVLYLISLGLVLISFSETAALVRYITVIFPLLAMSVASAFYTIFSQQRKKQPGAKPVSATPIATKFSLAFAIIISILAIPVYIRTVSSNLPSLIKNISGDKLAGYHPGYISFINACEWISENTDTSEGLICRKPQLSWWFSGRKSRNYLQRPDPDAVMTDIDTSGAPLVLVDQLFSSTQYFLIPAIKAHANRFSVLYVTPSPQSYVLRILPKEPGIPPDDVIKTP